MSAPDTNTKTQERRHKPVLIILRGLVILAVLLLIGFIATQTIGPDATDEGLTETEEASPAVD
ncbi:hypothetical protein HKCCE3408_07250 [Rhodobacterales bacterium HKCCE3408]|nr:hypothetical protein [Rhodobacterales bacterium HKCCE3408]